VTDGQKYQLLQFLSIGLNISHVVSLFMFGGIFSTNFGSENVSVVFLVPIFGQYVDMLRQFLQLNRMKMMWSLV
jgi:hypothetical protein